MINDSILKAVVCGYERGGTTLLNQILTSHPKLESGFESGLLLASKPKKFLNEGLSEYNGSLICNGWGLSVKDLHYIVAASSWPEVYLRLRECSSLVKNKNNFLTDKTPRYMLHLKDVLKRVPQVPAVVIVKSARGVIWSWLKRNKEISLDNIPDKLLVQYCNRYLSYAKGYYAARKAFPNRVLGVSYERLCINPDEESKKIFAFLGELYDASYVQFDSVYEVYGNTVSKDYLLEYERNLSPEVLKVIDKLTRQAEKYLVLDD